MCDGAGRSPKTGSVDLGFMGFNYFKDRCAIWRLIFYGFSALLGTLAIVLFLHADNGSEGVGRLRQTTGGLIIGNGCMPDSPKQALETESRGATRTAIYVLGGSQKSLRLKYHTVAGLYQKGGAKRLMIASVKGITEYAQDIDRNLTKDEWTVRQLTSQGVKCEDINFIMLKDGFFGTLREAKTLKTICIERGIKKLLLVCSTYHCKRVRSTFSAIFKNTGVKIDIHSADEQVGLRVLFIEYLKLIFYDNVLIPLERYFS